MSDQNVKENVRCPFVYYTNENFELGGAIPRCKLRTIKGLHKNPFTDKIDGYVTTGKRCSFDGMVKDCDLAKENIEKGTRVPSLAEVEGLI